MKFIEEYIRNSLRREPPPPVDAEDLWAGIAAGLPGEGKQPKSGPFLSRWLVGGALVLLLGLGIRGLWISDLSPGPDLVEDDPWGELTAKLGNDSIAKREGLPLGPVRYSSGLASPVAAALRRSGDRDAPSKEIIRNLNALPPSGTASPPAPNAPPLPEPPRADALRTGAGAKVPPAPAPPTYPAPAAPPASTNWSAVAQLPFPTLQQVAANRPPPTAALTPNRFRSAAVPRLSLALHAGGNYRLQHFEATEDGPGSALNEASGSATGQSVAADLRYRLNRQVSVSLGAEYHRTVNTFRHTIVSDTLVPHPTAPNTRPLESELLHTVRHNNRGEWVSAPLMLTYQRRLGDFFAGFSGGLSVNYQLTASGRSLDATGSFVRYEEPAYDRIFLAYHLRPELTVRLGPDSPWAVDLRTDVRYFNPKSSGTIGAAQRGWLVTPTVGVRYGITE